MIRNIILAGALIVSAYGQIQLVTPSVASTDDPLSILSNPAGLGFTNHQETMIFGHYDGEAVTKDFALYNQAGHGGFGYEWDSNTGNNVWTTSQGFKLSNSHTFGLTYSFYNRFWREGQLNLGWMHRPMSYLSLGASLTNAWSGSDAFKSINTGIAVQNKSGRFGVNIDASFEFDDSKAELEVQTSKYAGLFVEPIKGVRLTGYADISNDTPEYGLSLSLFMSDFGVESHSKTKTSSNQTFGFRTSINPYRSFIKEKIGKKDHQTYVRMHLDGLFIEEPERKKSPFDFDVNIPLLNPKQVFGKQLKKFIDEMKELTNDKSIDGLIIDLGYVRGGFSKVAEIRNALQKFHDAGKKVIVYSKTGLNNRDVFLTSMADEIYTHEMGGADLKGLSLEITFYRGLLDTLSITPEVWRISPFKTAGDAFLNRTMSDEMRDNYSQLFGGIYDEFVAGIAEGKGWNIEETRMKIDEGPYMITSKAIDAGLITGTKYPDEFEEYVEKLNDEKNTIIKFNDFEDVSDYVYGWRPDAGKEKIAVIYAVGGISTGKSKPSPSGSTVMGDETISEAIKQAREDKDVKAIVLRIDSGGGSALASDVMWREALKTTETDTNNIKPFIASMSSVAASGGYYIACQADSIIAAPSTITGSIGVIGLRLNFSQLQERFGIHTDRLKLGERSDFASGSRLVTDEESEMIMESIQDIYVTFKERVVKGREQITDIDALDEIALGRVWTGTDAVENGLIDKVGGYYDAIEMAKAAAGIDGDVEIVEYPKKGKKSSFSDMMKLEANLNILPEEIRESIDVLEMVQIFENDNIQMILPVKIVIK